MNRRDWVARFWSYVIKSDGCWLWAGAQTDKGYGKFNHCGTPDRAHRISWTITLGAIPDGLCVLHSCDRRLCVRPSHLFLGTRLENAADRDKKHRQVKGEQVHQAVLTEQDVHRIRGEFAGRRGQKAELARRYGVDKATITLILERRTWKHI